MSSQHSGFNSPRPASILPRIRPAKWILRTVFPCIPLLWVSSSWAAQNERPNILVIITDQQSAGDLGVAGNPWVRTPNLDKLAKRGVRFPTAYAANPVCVPSKFAMQTGNYASLVGVRYNEEAPDKQKNAGFAKNALGWELQKVGYETVFGGKVHLPGSTFGPMSEYGYSQLGTDGEVLVNPTAKKAKQVNTPMWDNPPLLANAGAEFLKKRKPDAKKPFLLFLSFESTIHDVCYFTIRSMEPESDIAKHAPQDVSDLEAKMLNIKKSKGLERFFSHPSPDSPGFDPENFAPPLPANHEPMLHEPQAIRNLIGMRAFREKARKQCYERGWREHRWMYARLTDEQDRSIGTVLEALQSSGLGNNTIVVFLSDHGDNDASHQMEHKSVFYNESSRVPFIFAGNGIIQGVVSDTTVSLVDLYPTVCDLAGIKPDPKLPGISLKPYLFGRTPEKPRKYVFLENQIGFMVTDGRYKYAWYDNTGNDEMFIDLETDPGETVNLMPQVEKSGSLYAEKYSELKIALREHLKQLKSEGAKIDMAGLKQ